MQSVLVGQPAKTILGDEEVQSSLAVLANLYGYNHWMFNKVRPFLGDSVCEVGSGTGNITQFLLNAVEVVGIEPSRRAFHAVEKRFAQHMNVRFVNCFLDETLSHGVDPGSFDSVVCMNVLEHIENDVAALQNMRRLVNPEGHVCIIVPAHQLIFGEVDRRLGHFRRYGKRSLGQAFASAGLRPVHSTYVNLPGFFGWGLFSRLLRRQRISIGGARIMNALVPFIDAVERLLYLPCGQSLLMIGQPLRGQAASDRA